MPRASTGLPDGFTVHWHGIDSTTPDGCITVSGMDALGNVTDLIMRGDDPDTAAILGRIVWPSRGGNLVYLRSNDYLAANLPAAYASQRIVAASDPS